MKYFTLKILFLIIVSCLLPVLANCQEWTFYTVGSGVKPSIAVDSQDKPHIAFLLENTSAGFVKHAVFDNNSFQTSTLGTSYYYGPLAIAIDPNDKAAVVTHDHTTSNEIYFYQDNQLIWQTEFINHFGHDGWDNAIVFDNQGFPHTSSVNPFGQTDGIEYAYKNGTGWNKETIAGTGIIEYKFGTTLALDANQVPHISYYSEDLDKLFYMNKVSGSWAMEVVDSTGGMFPSMVLDDNDVPHIVYYDRMGGSLSGIVKYVYKNGNEWVSQNVDVLYNVPISFGGARIVTSLKRDSTGVLHLSYGDRDVVKYATRNGGAWSFETVVNEFNTATLLGAQTSLALDNNNIPHITYFEVVTESPLTGTVIYTTPVQCVADLMVTESTVSGSYLAGNTIETSGAVIVQGSTSFSAPVSILLNAGFEVPAGNEFEVLIGGCN